MQTPRTDAQPTDVMEPASPSPSGAAPSRAAPGLISCSETAGRHQWSDLPQPGLIQPAPPAIAPRHQIDQRALSARAATACAEGPAKAGHYVRRQTTYEGNGLPFSGF